MNETVFANTVTVHIPEKDNWKHIILRLGKLIENLRSTYFDNMISKEILLTLKKLEAVLY